MIGCSCNKCGSVVPPEIKNHFVAIDGRILCEKCSIGVAPCSIEIKESLIKYQEKGEI